MSLPRDHRMFWSLNQQQISHKKPSMLPSSWKVARLTSLELGWPRLHTCGTVAWLFLHMYIYYIFQSTRPPFLFSGWLMWCLGVCWRVKHIICDVTAGRCSSSLVLTTEETLNLWHCWGDFFSFLVQSKTKQFSKFFLSFFIFFFFFVFF